MFGWFRKRREERIQNMRRQISRCNGVIRSVQVNVRYGFPTLDSQRRSILGQYDAINRRKVLARRLGMTIQEAEKL